MIYQIYHEIQMLKLIVDDDSKDYMIDFPTLRYPIAISIFLS